MCRPGVLPCCLPGYKRTNISLYAPVTIPPQSNIFVSVVLESQMKFLSIIPCHWSILFSRILAQLCLINQERMVVVTFLGNEYFFVIYGQNHFGLVHESGTPRMCSKCLPERMTARCNLPYWCFHSLVTVPPNLYSFVSIIHKSNIDSIAPAFWFRSLA